MHNAGIERVYSTEIGHLEIANSMGRLDFTNFMRHLHFNESSGSHELNNSCTSHELNKSSRKRQLHGSSRCHKRHEASTSHKLNESSGSHELNESTNRQLNTSSRYSELQIGWHRMLKKNEKNQFSTRRTMELIIETTILPQIGTICKSHRQNAGSLTKI